MNTGYFQKDLKDTICAVSTPPGTGAIAVIRLSGPAAFEIGDKIFRPLKAGVTLSHSVTHTMVLGMIHQQDEMVDEALAAVFHAPNSYSGEDIVEFSCHGSLYIQQRVLEVLTDAGARMAKPGEFTLRGFLNGKFDLTQAEAIADLIISNARTEHDLALKQMRGGFSKVISSLRQRLVDLSSLLELELDFSEEDVEFADRSELVATITRLTEEMKQLAKSFSFGNVIKQGIPVAIIGKPNVGKSTLLNALLNEERAIVSEIPGTTRDTIEDTLTIQGIKFRFIDTAGLRSHTSDSIESIGIGRTYEKIKEARVILYVFDVSTITTEEVESLLTEFSSHISDPDKRFILIGNKADLMVSAPHHVTGLFELETIFVSAKRKENINLVIDSLLTTIRESSIRDLSLISNARHYEAINRTIASLEEAGQGLENKLPSDLVATDIRSALYYLGEITGQVTNDEILGNIFSKFCIGK